MHCRILSMHICATRGGSMSAAWIGRDGSLFRKMRAEYLRIKEELGRRPSRLDMYFRSDIPVRKYLKAGWLSWLDKMSDLTEEERSWLGTPAEEFLIDVERTSMNKAYKMPTIGSLLSGGDISKRVSLETIGRNLMDFYANTPLHQKDLRDKSNREWRSWDAGKFADLARRNPVHFLSKGRFFHYDKTKEVFYLDDSLDQYLSPALAEHVRDILDFRTASYFKKRYPEEDQCIFCREPETELLCDNELARAFLDKFPVNEGHVLITPKRHVETYFDAAKEELAAINDLIFKVKEILDKRYNPDGYNIGVNVNHAGGQTVFHLHVHVIPRYEGDVEDPRGGVRNIKPGLIPY